MLFSVKSAAILAFYGTSIFFSGANAASKERHLKGSSPLQYKEEHRELFFQWMSQHGKHYSTSNDMMHRMSVWMDNHGTCLMPELVCKRWVISNGYDWRDVVETTASSTNRRAIAW